MNDPRWVVWWWPHDPSTVRDPFVPLERRFVYFADAISHIQEVAHPRTDWAKLFRSDDEADVRARWNRIEGWSELSPAANDELDY